MTSLPPRPDAFSDFFEVNDTNSAMGERYDRGQPLRSISPGGVNIIDGYGYGYEGSPTTTTVFKQRAENYNYSMHKSANMDCWHGYWDRHPYNCNNERANEMSDWDYYLHSGSLRTPYYSPYQGRCYVGEVGAYYADENGPNRRPNDTTALYHKPSYYQSQDFSVHSHQTKRSELLFVPQHPAPSENHGALKNVSSNCENATTGAKKAKISSPSPITDKRENVGALQPLDIVCGRGAPKNFLYGNQVFRELVEEYQTKYFCAKRSDKADIAMKVMDIVKARGGRFVRRQKAAGLFCWEPIGDRRAYEKVCQALRDGAPDLQRQVLSTLAVRAR
jgi:hypothetical protein